MSKTKEQCEVFVRHPSMNPVSKEYFDFDSPEYKEWASACDIASWCSLNQQECDRRFRLNGFCAAFQKDDSIDPMTKKSLKDTDKKKIRSICGFTEPAKTAPKLQDFSCQVPGANPNCITRQVDAANIESINEWIEAQRRYIEGLSAADKEVIAFYETVGMYEWNAVLRDVSKFCDSRWSTINEGYGDMISKAQRLYNIIMDAPRTPGMFLFRGERVKETDSWELPYDKKNSERLGFTSASFAITEAARFAAGGSWTGTKYVQTPPSERRVIAIRMPAGTPALFVGVRPGNTFDSRLEVVLPPHILEAMPGHRMTIETPEKPVPGATVVGVQYATVDVKTFVFANPLKLDLPDKFNGPSISELIQEFLDFAKKNNLANSDPRFQWVVKGGLGINTLLEHKYRMKNLMPSLDLDIGIFYNSTKVVAAEAQNFANKIGTDLNTFENAVFSKYKISPTRFFNKGPVQIGPSKVLFQIFYSLCGSPTMFEGVIDVVIDGQPVDFDTSKIETTVTDYFGLPIKTAKGYLEEVKDLLKRAIYLGQEGALPGQPGKTYGDRNPISGTQKEKGLKALDRATLLCKADVAGRTVHDYLNMCTILAEKVILGDTLQKSPADLETLFRHVNALD